MLSDAATREYLERMVPLQEASTENSKHLNEIKQEGRADGLNLEAVNALLPILVRHPYDKGAAVLMDVIRYAEALGAKSLVSQADGGSQPPPDSVSDAGVSQPAKAEVRSPAESRGRAPVSGPLRLSAQVVAAMFVTFGLIWLLN